MTYGLCNSTDLIQYLSIKCFRIKITKGIHRPRLLISGGNLSEGQGPHLAQALLYHMEHLPVQTLDVSTLFAESGRSPEETCVQVS